jgi:hypothetical protein
MALQHTQARREATTSVSVMRDGVVHVVATLAPLSLRILRSHRDECLTHVGPADTAIRPSAIVLMRLIDVAAPTESA